MPHNGYCISEEEFFSRNGIYSAYGELNSLLLNDNAINYEDLEIIPEILRNTNIDIFDARREKSWKEELNEYFLDKAEYSAKILEYCSVISFLDDLKSPFIDSIA